MNLAEFVTRRRKDRGYSIRQLSHASGGLVSPTSVCDLESGRATNIPVSMVIGLSKALKVSPNVIVEAAMETLTP